LNHAEARKGIPDGRLWVFALDFQGGIIEFVLLNRLYRSGFIKYPSVQYITQIIASIFPAKPAFSRD
jgi:hypothetical protein